MQGRNKNYNAFETTAVDDFAIALLCGEAEFKVPQFLTSPLTHTHPFDISILIKMIDVLRRHIHRLQPHPLLPTRLEIHARAEDAERETARDPTEYVP